VGVSILVSLLTLVAMIRIWGGVFWNPAEEPSASVQLRAVGRFGGPALMVIPTAVLLACSLAVALGAGTIYTLAEHTARDLMHPEHYIRAVTGR
jgi:multicomponent Na+:H+ antiporter subunit D